LGQFFIALPQGQGLFRTGRVTEGMPAGPRSMFDERQFPLNRFQITGLKVKQIMIVSQSQNTDRHPSREYEAGADDPTRPARKSRQPTFLRGWRIEDGG